MGVVIAAVIAIATAIVWVLKWVWVAPKRAESLLTSQGLCGNSYRLFHGDLKEAKAMRAQQETLTTKTSTNKMLSHDFFPRIRPLAHRCILNYGKNCLMWEGPVPMVNIGEAELVKEVLARYNDFHKPTANPIVSRIVTGLVSYEGHKWVLHRKLLNPAFHVNKLKLMQPGFYTSCSEMVKLWEEKVSKSENEIDVNNYLTNLSADVISRAAFGSSFEEGKRIFQLLRDQIHLASEISQSVYIPGLRFMPTTRNTKMIRIEREINKLIAGLIEKRKEGKETKDDLLGLMMESNSGNDDGGKKQKVRITAQEMVDECKLFYMAGQETTSSLLAWTMILLSQHQEWQDKAREEVLSSFGVAKPEFEGLNNLKMMNIIFLEVLRLYSPVIELRRTVAKHNTKLGELTLPKGTLVTIPLVYVQHDPQVWGDDAKEFNPERFSEGISKASRGSVSFMAFGWGPRICIGSNFAMLEAKLALAMILQRFKFELSPAYVHAPSYFGILHPRFGAPLVLQRL